MSSSCYRTRGAVLAGALSVLLSATPVIALAETTGDIASAELEVMADTQSESVKESETNNSFETAQVIQISDSVNGAKNEDGSPDFYKVTLSDKKNLLVLLKNEKQIDLNARIICRLYDENREEVGSFMGTVQHDYRYGHEFEVEPGTYYIKVIFDDNVPAGHPYILGAHLTPIGNRMYRLYNPYTGEHFYTASKEERDSLKSAGWNDEGTGWLAPKSSDTPVYRIYNPFAGDHHYTTSAEERDSLVNVGWNDEGIGWYSAGEDGAPIFRQYNPFASVGTHNYTADKGENDALVSAGWHEEGIGWYAVRG